MKIDALPPLPVMHLMRTYGAHGGEQQLSQYFGSEPRGEVSETFVFLYRDAQCSQLFAQRAPTLGQVVLHTGSVTTGTAWREFALLLPLLPLLQFRFLKLVWRRKPAVCVVHGFQGALVAWPAAMMFRKTAWAYVHRVTKSAMGSNPLFRLIYRPFDAVAGNSKAVTASLAPLTQQEKLATLENGLDWRSFDIRAEADLVSPVPEVTGPVLVSVGRLLPHKGQAIIIDAFDRIAGEFWNAALWIVGDGEEMDNLRRRANASPAANRIHLLGRREDVPTVLKKADIFVNASAWEGMSNAVLEGMAAALPSVVADAPGVTECHVEGVTGFVVERDARQIALAITRLLGDPGLRRKMGDAARLHARVRYSMEACRKRYLALFTRLTGRNVCAES
jgi:glycosyltransferase involved in cell wall biosynthesis